MIQILQIFIKFAHFLGATTMKGRNQIAKNKKRHPIEKSPMKYGYISLYSYQLLA